MTEDFRVVERRDDASGRDIGLLVYVNKETWDRLARLCGKTGGGSDKVVEEALNMLEMSYNIREHTNEIRKSLGLDPLSCENR